MPPFFATGSVSKSKTSRASTPRLEHSIPVRGAKPASTYSPRKLPGKRKQAAEYSLSEQTLCDSSSIADTESVIFDIKQFEVPSRSPFVHADMPGGRNQPEKFAGSEFQGRDRASRQEPSRAQGRQSTPRTDQHEIPEVDEYPRGYDTPFLGNDTPFPSISIYEQIHQLRLHGATVKFTSKSRGDCLLPDNFGRNNAAYRRGSNLPDPLNPTDVEINSLNYALANVLNAGGDIEFLPLPLKQQSTSLQCETCSEIFERQQDLHDHISYQIKCKICRVPIPCQTFLEGHMSKVHPHRNSGSYPSSAPATFTGSRERDELPQWQQ